MLARPITRDSPASQNRIHSVEEENLNMAVHYLEIVSNDVDALTALYERMHDLSFGPADPDLGEAHVATRPDGTLVGIRKPLAAHEQPIVRTYLAVDDIPGPAPRRRRQAPASRNLRPGRAPREPSACLSWAAGNRA